MNPGAYDLMSLFADCPFFEVNRTKVVFPPVVELRRSLRSIAVCLNKEEDAQGRLFREMFSVISALQVSPVVFDEKFYEAVSGFFPQNTDIKNVWGPEVFDNLNRAKSLAYDLIGEPNPLSAQFLSKAREAKVGGLRFKLSVSGRDRELITHMFAKDGVQISEQDFLCTASRYAESGCFDVLLRLGPLLTWGRGSAPAAILSGPKFLRMEQVVWDGSADDADFGDDAVIKFDKTIETMDSPVVSWRINSSEAIAGWAKEMPGQISTRNQVPENDFEVFRRENSEMRNSRLLKIDERYGVIYPPSARVMVLNLSSDRDERVFFAPATSVFPGEFIAVVKNLSGGQSHSTETGFERSQRWKSELRSNLTCDADAFKQKLEQAGLALASLGQQLRHWASDPTSVIHAPQRQEHFQILCSVMGLDGKDESVKSGRQDFWRLAWDDIRVSRGEAISAGFERTDIFYSHVLSGLGRSADEICHALNESPHHRFFLAQSDGWPEIAVDIYRVIGTEDGLLAPQKEFFKILELDYIQQWLQ
jgi:hypothetical protein